MRTIRSDPRMIALVGLPVWEPREWELEEGQRPFELRRRALALVTPERFAKGDIHLFGSTVMARGRRVRDRRRLWSSASGGV